MNIVVFDDMIISIHVNEQMWAIIQFVIANDVADTGDGDRTRIGFHNAVDAMDTVVLGQVIARRQG